MCPLFSQKLLTACCMIVISNTRLVCFLSFPYNKLRFLDSIASNRFLIYVKMAMFPFLFSLSSEAVVQTQCVSSLKLGFHQ